MPDEQHQGYNVAGESLARIGRSVRYTEGIQQQAARESRDPNRRFAVRVEYVKLSADLDAAADYDSPQYASGVIQVAQRRGALGALPTPNAVLVENRSGVSVAADTVGLAAEIAPGHWIWLNAAEGGGEKTITFTIVSSDPTNRSAEVEIRQRTFLGPAYGSTLDDTVVTVYDTNGCYLNEPNVDLTGRNGTAKLFFVDAEAEAIHFPDYDVPEKYWMVIGLCCPNTVCA